MNTNRNNRRALRKKTLADVKRINKTKNRMAQRHADFQRKNWKRVGNLWVSPIPGSRSLSQ